MRGVKVDHAIIQRWVFKFTPLLETKFRTRKGKVEGRWRMDERYVKVKGKWMYLYRAVDKQGQTVDLLLSSSRKKRSAQAFLIKAIKQNGEPSLINIDKSGANQASFTESKFHLCYQYPINRTFLAMRFGSFNSPLIFTEQ